MSRARTYVDKNKYICSLCLPKVKEIGEVIPGIWLGLDKEDGKYIMVGNDGHGGHVVHKFKDTPWIDQLEKRKGETEKQWEKRYNSAPKDLLKKNEAWLKMVMKELGWKIDMDDMMSLATKILEGGWKTENGCVSLWLYMRCANLVLKHQKNGASK